MSKRKNAENQLEDSLKKQIDDDFKISKPNYRLDEIQPDDDLKSKLIMISSLTIKSVKSTRKSLRAALVQQIDNDFTFKKLNQELDENQLDDVIEKQIDNDYTFKKQNQDIVVDEDDLEDGRKFTAAKSDGAISSIYDWIRCLIFAFTIVVICLTFVFRLVEVEGSSMDDTLSTQDKVVVTNFMYKPQNNDIIVISHGAAYENPIIKRVIATEGQTLKLDYVHEQVIVNGVVLNEPYIKESTFSETFANYDIPEVIPEGKIFVMGDNRRVSLDSRNKKIGLVDVDDVIGKAQFVAFPFDHLGYLY